MKHANMLVASAAVIALTLGVTSRADTDKQTQAPLPLGSFIVAADDTPAAGKVDDGEGSAKMGEEPGTHEGDNLGATPENDTSKIDQPARRNPTTGEAAH
jgi:hypothetical protein